MSVRVKTLATVLTVLLGMGLILLATVARSGRAEADRNDRSVMAHQGDSIEATLRYLLAELSRSNNDYACWDEMHDYCLQPTREFVDTNLDLTTLSSQLFGLVLVARTDGTALTARGVDLARHIPVTPGEGFRRLLLDDASLRAASLKAGGVRGVRVVDGQPVLFSACAVLTSQRTGPPAGIMAIGRPLSGGQLAVLSQLSQVDVEVRLVGDVALPTDVAAQLHALPAAQARLHLARPGHYESYLRLCDEQNRPALYLRYNTPRSHLAHQIAEIRAIALAMAGLTLVAALLCVWLLNRLVLDRLSRLTRFVGGLTPGRVSAERFDSTGPGDELRDLADALNQALDRESAYLAEQHAAHEALGASEQRLRALVEHSADVVVVLDSDYRLTYVSDSAYSLLGYAPDDVVGRRDTDFCHPEDLAGLREAQAMVVSGSHTSVKLAVRLRHHDGRFLWFEVAAVDLRSDQYIRGVVAGLRLIEDQKREESRLLALSHSAELLLSDLAEVPFQAFVDAIGPASGADRVYVFLNQVSADGERCCSEQAEWLAPGTAPHAHGPAGAGLPYAAALSRWREQILADGQLAAVVDEMAQADQAHFQAQGIRALLLLPILLDGEFAGMVGFDRCFQGQAFSAGEVAFLRNAVGNLSQALRHQRTRQALSESERMYRLVTANALDMIWTSDLEGRFTYVSPSVEAMRGWTPEEVIGQQTFADVVTPESYLVVMAELRRNLEELAAGRLPSGTMVELEQPRRDGNTIWTETRARPMLDAAGTVIGFAGVTRDITDRIAAQREREAMLEQLRQATKMEAIGQLAGGLAHDFNNLLTTIGGYCDLLRGAIGHDPEALDDLDQVQAAASRAASLTRQLLAFSRQSANEPRSIDLNNVVRGMELMLRRIVPEHIILRCDLCSEPALVTADPGQMEQALMNLVVNSRQAVADHGEIVIRTGHAERIDPSAVIEGEVSEGAQVVLAVSDTGHGMDEETRQRIFDPFFTTKPMGVGTGLGLAMVYGIVRQNQGHIGCQSVVGQGTTFSIYLPASAAAHDEAEDAGGGTANLRGGETILVVEDDAAVRLITERILRGLGYTVLAPADVDQALATLADASQPLDLLLTDVVMPKMSGGELAKQAIHLRPDLPVLYVSGYAESVVVSHGVVPAGIELLNKPFTAAELAGRVRRMLDAVQASRR